MGCSSCGKRRRRAGEAVTAPHIIGSTTGHAVRRVKVQSVGIVPGAGVGSIRFVIGEGAEEAIGDGRLRLLSTPSAGVTPTTITGVGGILYCVGEGDARVCYTDRESAAVRAAATGERIVERPVGEGGN